MANLTVVNGRWVNLDKPGGQVFFVGGGSVAYRGKGASDDANGLSPQNPLATIAAALTSTTTGRGDTVVVLPGNVTIAAALALSNDDVTLTGVDSNGSINPSAITVNGAVDGIAVTGANAVIENLHFPASTLTGVTSRIDAGAVGLVVRNNTIECGQFDLESITVPAAGDDLLVENNRFYITANGPDAAIEIESATAERTIIRNNIFSGDNDTNKWDAGAINSGAAHIGCLVTDNIFWEGLAVEFTAAATGIIARNFAGEGATLGQAFDPGSCMCFENYEADAVDESGRIFPTGIAI
jgi:hypothetical protein